LELGLLHCTMLATAQSHVHTLRSDPQSQSFTQPTRIGEPKLPASAVPDAQPPAPKLPVQDATPAAPVAPSPAAPSASAKPPVQNSANAADMCVVMYMCAQQGSTCAKVEWSKVASAARARRLTGRYDGLVPHFALLSVRNKAAYAAVHGYTFLLAEELYASDVSTASPRQPCPRLSPPPMPASHTHLGQHTPTTRLMHREAWRGAS